MSTATTSPSKPLAARSPNTSSPSPTKAITSSENPVSLTKNNNDAAEQQLKKPAAAENFAPQSMEYHRQVLQNRLAADNADKQTYVSPSDTIMSPCTAKLSAYKGKKFAKAKPQSLFAKTASKGPLIDSAQQENVGEDIVKV